MDGRTVCVFARAREGDAGRGHASRLQDWPTCWMTWGIVSIDEQMNTGVAYPPTVLATSITACGANRSTWTQRRSVNGAGIHSKSSNAGNSTPPRKGRQSAVRGDFTS